MDDDESESAVMKLPKVLKHAKNRDDGFLASLRHEFSGIYNNYRMTMVIKFCTNSRQIAKPYNKDNEPCIIAKKHE